MFYLLIADHKIQHLRHRRTTERGVKTREELFTQSDRARRAHAHRRNISELEKADETHDITLEAFEEHRLVKQLLGELEKMDKGDEQWTARFTVLKENIEHHVEEEETDMFPKAKKVLGDEKAEELGTRMEAAKNKELKAAAAGLRFISD